MFDNRTPLGNVKFLFGNFQAENFPVFFKSFIYEFSVLVFYLFCKVITRLSLTLLTLTNDIVCQVAIFCDVTALVARQMRTFIVQNTAKLKV